MTPDEFRQTLRRAAENAGGVAKWAKGIGVSRQYVSNVLNNPEAPPSDKILSALGLAVVIDYAPINPKFESAHLTMRDCTDPEIRKDAEHDLRRAIERREAFAMKWGEALIRGYESADRSDEVADLEIEANELEAEKFRAVSRMDDAATQLERLANREETPDEIADKLTAIIELLDTSAI